MKQAIESEATWVPASISVFLSDQDRVKLEGLLRSGKTDQRLARRIGIVLTFAEGLSAKGVAGKCGCTLETARLRRDRWVHDGLRGLSDAPGRGRKLEYSGDKEAKIMVAKRWKHRKMQRTGAPGGFQGRLKPVNRLLKESGVGIDFSLIYRRRSSTATILNWLRR